MWAPARRLAKEAEYKAAMRKKGEASMADGLPAEKVSGGSGWRAGRGDSECGLYSTVSLRLAKGDLGDLGLLLYWRQDCRHGICLQKEGAERVPGEKTLH
ncbi:unnamed protein product [Chondrus crispus]|uniref:Uncharacterized protein n=1 Tax=Chondrus crispus TaxID=2769 RepID=R7QPC0_CHOCR|nr:unnamed protein product [Chondrus crispus]CDF39934.1 unnamed protein product [Chondrus crispus]|eukprot:XP_005710228.1 unnamed protein product [Chondrus crispus]